MQSDLSTVIAASSRIGSYFTLKLADGPEWLPFAELTGSRDTIAEYVRRTRAILAVGRGLPEDAIETRIAASSFHLNSAAMLLSPALGCAVLGDCVPDLSAGNLVWRPGPTHLLETGTRVHVGAADLDDDQIVERIHTVVLGAVGELNEAIHDATGLSRKVLWGNVASAFNGAFLVLRGQRPDDEERAHELLHAILEHGRLETTGRFLPDEWDVDRFSRNSCCLFYRLPDGGLCGDCVLAERRAGKE